MATAFARSTSPRTTPPSSTSRCAVPRRTPCAKHSTVPRNLVLYAYFDYDLLVNAEIQALGAVELALRLRLAGQTSDTLHNLVERARKHGIFPKWSRAQPIDRAQSLVAMRNGLSHGTTDIHTPGMTMIVLEGCGWAIDCAFP